MISFCREAKMMNHVGTSVSFQHSWRRRNLSQGRIDLEYATDVIEGSTFTSHRASKNHVVLVHDATVLTTASEPTAKCSDEGSQASTSS